MILINGKVIKGQGLGRILGFPTANLDRREYIKNKMKVRFGVWAGWVGLKGKKFKAAIVIGPLDSRRLPKIEAYLLNFKGNLYGKKLTINLTKFLRPFKAFKTQEKLKRQISLDIAKVKKL